jgi:epoxyqueuosine reductase
VTLGITAPGAAIRARALETGFDAVGFAPAELGNEAADHLRAFLARGYHGDMGWMPEKVERRVGPTALWPEAKSVIALGMNYTPADDPLALAERPDRGVISVYARNRDYHDLVKKRLKQLGRWIGETWGCGIKVFVDTAPVMEKPLAARAGIGWQGKHTNLVSRTHGSWLFLGEIYTTIAVPAAIASTSARPTPFPRPARSTQGAASRTSPSSTKARSRKSCGH